MCVGGSAVHFNSDKMGAIVKHFLLGFIIRIVLIVYGEFHDKTFLVSFTDVDYKVFTDAARNVLMGASPYSRHTYRYSPILAYVLTPNIIIHQTFGKVLFSILDLIMAKMLRSLMLKRGVSVSNADISALFWLYNPISIIVSTRGNADTLSSLIVITTLLCLYSKKPFTAGIVHGLCIHMRLYPLVYSLPLYLSLSANSRGCATPSVSCEHKRDKTSCQNLHQRKHGKTEVHRDISVDNVREEKSDILYFAKQVLFPNVWQVKLVVGCVFMLGALTFAFYWMYGYSFLHESMLYHLSRKDIRHNFSVYFYLQYLSAGAVISVWQRALMFLPQLVLLVALSIRYGRTFDLPFCLLAQTIVIVMYNPVITSQYFVWFLSLLPACVPMLDMPLKQALFHSLVWVVAQLAWLLPAYWLEFRGEDTFVYIWLQGIAFFCANITLLARLIRAYKPVQILVKIK